MIKLPQLNIITFILMATFGTTDIRSIIGYGSVQTDLTGNTSKLGMNDTNINDNHRFKNTRVFGLEDMYSSGFEYCNAYIGIIGDRNVLKEYPTNNVICDIPINNDTGWISKIQIGDNLSMMPTELKGSSSTGFVSRYVKNITQLNSFTIVSNTTNDNTTGGPFYKTYNDIKIKSNNIISRLSFSGNLIEYTDVEAFKALPIIN